MKRNVATGAVAGAAGGTLIGLASCGPFLWGPPVYAVCAMSGFAVGLLGGAIAGGVVTGISNPAPGIAVSREGADTPTFEEARRRTDQQPANNAIAVAIDSGRLAWGTAGAAATEDEAKAMAMQRCREQASARRIAKPCAIYSVNGQASYLDLR